MLSAVSSVRAVVGAGARLDNWAGWLHRGLTAAALLLCSVVVSARQYAGDPIDCLFRGAGEHKALDAYCWVQSTFTSARALDPAETRAHPGVGPEAPGERMRHHAYYRWASHALLLQAAASAAPHCLWAAFEGGAAAAAASKEGLKGAARLLAGHRGNGALTGWVLLCCEALNLAIDVAQMFFMNLFLDGEFFRHGFEVFPESALGEESREDALARLFPRVTKCSFRQYGPSGDVQTLDGLCVLPINVFNEKVYVVLWFWYWLLASVAALNLLYRAVLVSSSSTREWRLRAGFLCNTDDAKYFAREATFSQFMLAVTLGRQIGGREEFRDILKEVVQKMKEKRQRKAKRSGSGDRIHILPARGSYQVNCDGVKMADHGDQCSMGDSEPPTTGRMQMEGASDRPKWCSSHSLGVPTRSTYVSCDRAVLADRSYGGVSDPPVDGSRREDADLGLHRRSPRGPPDCSSLSVVLRSDPRVRAAGARLAGADWGWPAALAFSDSDDPKRPEAQEGARDQLHEAGVPPGSDLKHMGHSVRKYIEKIEQMEISPPDKQGPAGAKEKPPQSHSRPEASLEPPAGDGGGEAASPV